MSKYGEPWDHNGNAGHKGSAYMFHIAGDETTINIRAERAGRIVATMNACAGIPDPQTAMDAAREALVNSRSLLAAYVSETDDIGQMIIRNADQALALLTPEDR